MSRCDNACLLSCERPDARPYPLKLTVQLSFAAQREQSERIRREKREREGSTIKRESHYEGFDVGDPSALPQPGI